MNSEFLSATNKAFLIWTWSISSPSTFNDSELLEAARWSSFMTGARMSHQYHSFSWVVHFCPWCPEQLEGHLKFSLLAHLLCLADEVIILHYGQQWFRGDTRGAKEITGLCSEKDTPLQWFSVLYTKQSHSGAHVSLTPNTCQPEQMVSPSLKTFSRKRLDFNSPKLFPSLLLL